MHNHSQKTNSKASFYRLMAATLTIGGVSLSMPLLATAQTASGTSIINRATGTYEDPSQPGIPINTTSNTVTVTVAEVAGITAIGNGIVDSTPLTPVLGTDTLTYSFLITNVGNDTTRVSIPTPVLTGPATLTGANTYDIDANGDGTFETNGATLATAQLALLSPLGKIRVNIPVLVDVAATSGAPIVVRLGDTAPNDNSAGTQNQASTGLATDLRTIDGVTPADVGETVGAPTNGEREASAVAQILVGANPQAFAAVLKTQGIYSNNATPLNFSDDLQTYNLTLRVDAAAPAGASPSLTPADLTGTSTTVDNVVANRILVSDAIPANTVLTAAPIAPLGWTVVYTTSVNTIDANAALWTAAPPAFPTALGTFTRVGFTNAGPITRGTTVTGFVFQVRTTGVPAAGGSVYNIAQLFGQSVGGTTVVYDESGDVTPSNFNNDGTVGPGPNTNPAAPKGVANPANDGIDNLGTNTGTGPGGEDNVLTLLPAGTLLNGPLNAPAAVGPTNNNDDFTNKSTTVPFGTNPAGTIDPPSLTFTNTLNAPTTALTNVLLRPIAPATAGDLPTNTTATLTFGTQTATYTYNGAAFIFTPLPGDTAIQIPNIPANSSVNYTVAIDLPLATSLSTNIGRGYPVPILAFSDTGAGPFAGNGTLDTGEASNITIDRVYTGFLRLLKTSQVFVGTGPAVIGTDGTPSTTVKTPSPGNILRYIITYDNISTAPVGVGNIILDATNVVITDSGILNTAVAPTAPNGNNWGQDYSVNGVIDTSHALGSAVDSGTGSVITFFAGTAGTTAVTEQSGTTPATDITRYVNTLSVPVTPGSAARTFRFDRKLN
jgi:hypothetical protein